MDRLARVWAQVSERLSIAIRTGELRSDLSVEELLSALVGPALMAVVLEGGAAVTERKIQIFTELVLYGIAGNAPTQRRKVKR